ncbi:MAG: NifU family protein [Treponema sp.]|nr:NifU family protein [Treponema sp.]MBR4004880.1 NifU family protein [Treponema sp.]
MVDESLKSKVLETLDAFRPALNAEGGDMEFIEIDDDKKVHIKLTGACDGCPMATMTLKMGIERYLKETCPEITEVVQEF